MVENADFLVACRVSDLSRIKWHLNGATIPLDPEAGISATSEVRGQFIYSELKVQRARHEHSGNYSCTTFVDNAHEVIVISGKAMVAPRGGDYVTNVSCVVSPTDGMPRASLTLNSLSEFPASSACGAIT